MTQGLEEKNDSDMSPPHFNLTQPNIARWSFNALDTTKQLSPWTTEFAVIEVFFQSVHPRGF